MNNKFMPSKFNLTQWLLERVKNKEKPSFYSNQRTVSYFQLESEIKAAAAALKAIKIQPKQRVVISLNDSIELVVIFLASIAIGAYPIILNPRLNPKTLSYIINDSSASLIFIESENLSILKQTIENSNMAKIPTIMLSNSKFKKYINNIEFLNISNNKFNNYIYSDQNDPLFIQYTSGTTGDPKGVVHSSQSILSSCELFAKQHLKIESHDVLYSISKMFFGYGMGNSIFFTLYFGASAVIDNRWPTIDIILENIDNYSPTILFGTPVIYKNLLEENLDKSYFSKFKLLFSAGSLLSKKLQLEWNKSYCMNIYEGFGNTEMCHVIITNDLNNFKPGSTGKIVNGYEYRLATQEGDIDLDNTAGVLEVKGPSMTTGYWNKKSLTQERFRNGWYNTGDIFSIDNNGFFYYHGRSDDLFKIKGRWVIPSTMESYLKKHFTEITDAFLVPKSDDIETIPVLILFGNFRKNHKIIKSIFDALAENFQSFEVPSEIILLNSLPHNDNGKVIRSLLLDQVPQLQFTRN